ncbi:MAG: hypothetical protein IJ193_05320 [Bacilli bacterium]|nr:hypothetical protein [Bacilli bacterium]
MIYDKKELLEKLNRGEDLREDEYRVLILNGQYQLRDHLFLMKTGAYQKMLLGYASVGMLATKMEDGEMLAKSCAYMVGTYSTDLFHYESGLKYVEPCIKHMSRFNTINFLNQVRETNQFDSYIGELHDTIQEVLHYGIQSDSDDKLEESLTNLEESREKIKVIKKKYIGFSL